MDSQQTAHNIRLMPTVGLVGGMTIQFAEGRWPGEIGDGVAVSDDDFDLIEPCIRAACPDWTAGHRYGVFDLSVPARVSLAKLPRTEATLRSDGMDGLSNDAKLLGSLADWMDARCGGGPISILGY